MTIGAQIDSTISQISRVFSSHAPNGAQGPYTGLAGALALAIASGYLFLPKLDRSTLAAVKKAPELEKEGAYPENVFEGGSFLKTPLGRIRYYDFGPKDGEKVILVHGITTPSPVWKSVAPKLVEAGYRVLSFDLYGRGYSDSPQVPHTVDLFMSQLSYLIAALPEWDEFHLVGMSLGGAIIANFAHYFPNRVKKVVLICPAGATPREKIGHAGRLYASNYVSTGVMQALSKRIGLGLPLPASNPMVGWQLSKHPGFVHSFFSSFREGPVFDQAEVFKAVIKSYGDRLSTIWGDADTIVPMASIDHLGAEGDELRKRLTVVPNGEHFIVVTHPEAVTKALLKDLKG